MSNSPPALTRLGPRPLPYHLMAQLANLVTSQAALPLWKSGALASRPNCADGEPELLRLIAAADARGFEQALRCEAVRRSAAFLKGVEVYRRHDYRRVLPEMAEIWRQGSTRLIDYGADAPAAPPVLVVPSLINRAYILDLTARRSLLRDLRRRGLRPLLVDWGQPGPAEQDFALDDYIAGRLAAILEHVRRLAGRPPVLLGYCMGGLLALALAALRPEALSGLVLLATPWDFHRPDRRAARQIEALRPALERVLTLCRQLPADLLQILFALPDPGAVARKFRHFAALRPGSAAARHFVAVEDWANDCVPLTAAVARQTLFGWYGANQTADGSWRVDGCRVRPEAIGLPTLLLIPTRDRIVPPEQALALAHRLPQASTRMVDGGHVGMLLGPRAPALVYAVIAKAVQQMAAAAA